MKINIKLWPGILIMVLVFFVAGCNQNTAEQKGVFEPKTTVPQPVWNVGSDISYPPFEFVENDQYVGFDIDLIKAIAAVEGCDIKINKLNSDALIPSVTNGTVDCIISSITIKEEQAKQIDFSKSYFKAGLIIAVDQKNEDIKSLDDLKGKKLAAEVQTTGLEACNAVKAKDPKTTVKEFKTVLEAFSELEKGGVDAVINDMPVTNYYINSKGKDKVKMVGGILPDNNYYGIGVKKGNVDLLIKINSGFDKLKANGEYNQIYKKWFGDIK
ncbi:MAG: basic amino acid ABC transporter substrate-binding protein [Firmicutes bacterium HGW-Firmicutes-15]|nr:MAG: basic amino acid ABC transporter substrate-binding protein [Firmicutes bacterium HGW-Firmicutes-15]